MGKLSFCEKIVYLNRQPISFAGRPYLPAIYDSTARNLVLRCSRQTESPPSWSTPYCTRLRTTRVARFCSCLQEWNRLGFSARSDCSRLWSRVRFSVVFCLAIGRAGLRSWICGSRTIASVCQGCVPFCRCRPWDQRGSAAGGRVSGHRGRRFARAAGNPVTLPSI